MPIFFAPVLASVPAAVRRDIEDVHRRIARQYVAKRYDDMVALTTARYTPEFVDFRTGQPPRDLLAISEMRDNELQNLRAGIADGPVRWATRLDGWARSGDTLTVVAHHDVDGQWFRGGRLHPVRFKSTVLETWVLRGGEWKALRFIETGMKGTVDGKPFPPKA